MCVCVCVCVQLHRMRLFYIFAKFLVRFIFTSQLQRDDVTTKQTKNAKLVFKRSCREEDVSSPLQRSLRCVELIIS